MIPHCQRRDVASHGYLFHDDRHDDNTLQLVHHTRGRSNYDGVLVRPTQAALALHILNLPRAYGGVLGCSVKQV